VHEATLREAWEQRWDAEERLTVATREDALARLPALVEVLVERFGARCVILIGSLADGGFRVDSDIDLVVAGLEPALFWRAGAALDALAGRSVDLIPFEAMSDAMRQGAERGRILHGTP
jgi:predicted nucleotidyltransferase